MLIPFGFKIFTYGVIISISVAYGYAKGSEKAAVQVYQLANKNQELQIALEREQQNIKERVITEYVDKVRTVTEKEYVYVDQANNVVPNQHDVSNGWVYLHDFSTKPQSVSPDSARSADEASSGVADNQALATIVGNYSRCLQNTAQLIALQDWVKQTQDYINSLGKRKWRLWKRE